MPKTKRPEKKKLAEDVIDEPMEEEVQQTTPKPKQKPKKKQQKKSEVVSHAEIPTHIVFVSPNNISIGDKMIGVVSAINDHNNTLSIGLPDGLSATADFQAGPLVRQKPQVGKVIDEESEEEMNVEDAEEEEKQEQRTKPSTKLSVNWEIGQIVSCCVSNVSQGSGKYTYVRVSLNPQDVNSGLDRSVLTKGSILWCSIKGIEDNGYTLETGLDGPSAFMSKPKDTDNQTMNIGQFLFTTVLSISKTTGVITVEPKVPNQPVTEMTTRESLRPGMIVSSLVLDRLSLGLVLAAQDVFPATCPFTRLSHSDIANAEISSKIITRVIAVSHNGQEILLSSLPHILEFEKVIKCPDQGIIGELLDAEVSQVIPKIGTYLTSANKKNGSSTQILVKEQLYGGNKEEPPQVKERVKCRIIGIDYFGSIPLGSLLPIDLERKPLRPQDLHPGQIIDGRVRGVKQNRFVFVTLSSPKTKSTSTSSTKEIESDRGTLTAVCNSLHMADTPIDRPDLKFIPGSRFHCRILSIDPHNGKIYVTHKKTLIDSTLPPLCSYSDAKQGSLFQGVVSKILPNALIVTFYSGVYGIVIKSEMSRGFVTDPNTLFHVGQSVVCRVVSSNPSEGHLSLSLLLSGSKKNSGDEGKEPSTAKTKQESQESTSASQVEIGSIVKGTIKESVPGGFIVELTDSGQQAFLSEQHLTDHESNVAALSKLCVESKEFDELIILRQEQGHSKKIHVSAKRSLINAAKENKLPKTMEELKEISPESVDAIPCHILAVKDFGCIVGFLGSANALAPKSLLSDRFVVNPSDYFVVGQSVLAHITENTRSQDDEAEEKGEGKSKIKVIVSLKQSVCASSDDGELFSRTLFEELEQISAFEVEKSEFCDFDWAPFTPGKCVKATVHEIKDYGNVLHFENAPSLTGFLPTFQQEKQQTYCVGDEITVFILDIDKAKGIADVSTRSELVSEPTKKSHKEACSLLAW